MLGVDSNPISKGGKIIHYQNYTLHTLAKDDRFLTERDSSSGTISLQDGNGAVGGGELRA